MQGCCNRQSGHVATPESGVRRDYAGEEYYGIRARVLFIPHAPFVRKINKFINKGRVTPQVESYTYKL